jgi:hypothetical protein
MARFFRGLALSALAFFVGATAAAQDPTALARSLSNQAFALLDTLNATHAEDQPSALLGPIGMYAADSQSLLRALKDNEDEQAGVALSALVRDQTAVDSALPSAGADLNRAQWARMKQELAALRSSIPATVGSAPPSAPVPGPGAASDLAVRIDSTRFDSADRLHIKGLITGRDITSAGIYAGDREITDLRPTPDRRDQRIELDLTIEPPPAGSVIRVYDSAGHSAQAAIAVAGLPAESGQPLPPMNRPAPNISITISQFQLVNPALRQYSVAGEIAGSDMTHAGIYVGHRMVRQIPVLAGTSYHVSNFATSFELRGAGASVRVYTRDGRYQETPLNDSQAYGANTYPAEVYNSFPATTRIQITGMQPIGPNLMAVSGVIYGLNVVGAGIYQNGQLIAPINVSGPMAGTPGGYRQIPFVARFNTALGIPVVQAMDASGTITSQPIYGGQATFPPTFPYGANPYPYGANPYGTSPYGILPYGGSTVPVVPGPGVHYGPFAPGPGVSPH